MSIALPTTADDRADATADDDRAGSTADDRAVSRSTADDRVDSGSTADDHAAPRPRLKEQSRLIKIENERRRPLLTLEHCITLSLEEQTELLKRHRRCPFTGTWRRKAIATGVVPAMEPCCPCTVLRLARSVVEEAGRLADMDEDEKAGEPLGFKHIIHRNNHLRRTTEVVRNPMTTQILRKCGNCSEVHRRGIVKSDIAVHWRQHEEQPAGAKQ